MRVAIAGAGNVGISIALDLMENGHEVVVIERDPVIAAKRQFAVDAVWKVGDACEYSTLDEIEGASLDVVVAATGDDEDNLVISLLAKQEFAIPRVVARVNHPKNQWLFNETWGVDVSVSTPHILTSLVEEAVSVGSLVRLMSLEGGDARLVEVKLAAGSPAIGKSTTELSDMRDANIVGVVRAGHVLSPGTDTVVTVGDEVLVLVSSADGAEDEMKQRLVG